MGGFAHLGMSGLKASAYFPIFDLDRSLELFLQRRMEMVMMTMMIMIMMIIKMTMMMIMMTMTMMLVKLV